MLRWCGRGTPATSALPCRGCGCTPSSRPSPRARRQIRRTALPACRAACDGRSSSSRLTSRACRQ
eukprot:1176832-Prorocentrum_minimum.AAC.1